ncbi:hypothetical protein [uncultured Agrobacterium sp.]|uniref:hypothetical protein n=1 Tax=uncultured Agrobacterium sp. TaxID=157277 RepID=UPI0025D33F94|nr:hypothetical protein [uncultured Agrobacterium sp.]
MARKPRTYYTLLMKDGTPSDKAWEIAFGDYDRETVVAELQDYRDHGWKLKELKIVTTKGHGMDAINAVLAKLNAGDAA